MKNLIKRPIQKVSRSLILALLAISITAGAATGPISDHLRGLNDFARLGTTAQSTLAETRLAYRQLIKKYHPDANFASSAEELADKEEAFKLVSAAYARILKHEPADGENRPGDVDDFESRYKFTPEDMLKYGERFAEYVEIGRTSYLIGRRPIEPVYPDLSQLSKPAAMRVLRKFYVDDSILEILQSELDRHKAQLLGYRVGKNDLKDRFLQLSVDYVQGMASKGFKANQLDFFNAIVDKFTAFDAMNRQFNESLRNVKDTRFINFAEVGFKVVHEGAPAGGSGVNKLTIEALIPNLLKAVAELQPRKYFVQSNQKPEILGADITEGITVTPTELMTAYSNWSHPSLRIMPLLPWHQELINKSKFGKTYLSASVQKIFRPGVALSPRAPVPTALSSPQRALSHSTLSCEALFSSFSGT
jgi:curved DNA-binding protein CbpA